MAMLNVVGSQPELDVAKDITAKKAKRQCQHAPKTPTQLQAKKHKVEQPMG